MLPLDACETKGESPRSDTECSHMHNMDKAAALSAKVSERNNGMKILIMLVNK